MKARANIVMLPGTKLLGTARSRSIITDRPAEDGGTDAGFTSGEMLLLAIGSCASGSLRRHFSEQGIVCRDLSVDVFFEPSATPGARDRIVIGLTLDDAFRKDPERIKAAAISGGVTGRLAENSGVEVRFTDPGRRTGGGMPAG